MSEVVVDPPEVYQALRACLKIEFSMDSDDGILQRAAKFVELLFTLKVGKSEWGNSETVTIKIIELGPALLR